RWKGYSLHWVWFGLIPLVGWIVIIVAFYLTDRPQPGVPGTSIMEEPPRGDAFYVASAMQVGVDDNSPRRKCWRCQAQFLESELGRLPFLMGLAAVLLALGHPSKWGTFSGELRAVYCRRCRRFLTVCLAFLSIVSAIIICDYFTRR